MPIKIANIVQGSPRERLDAFRKTIKADEGYSTYELAALPEIGASRTRIDSILREEKWSITIWSETLKRKMTALVNPKTLAKHANKTKL